MALGRQIILWRGNRGFGQAELAQRAGLTRPYLSRLETDRADPSLSVLRRLAVALGLSLGELLEQEPARPELDRHELDQLARSVFHPNAREYRRVRGVRTLAKAFGDRRAALGLSRARAKPPQNARGKFALRRLRAELGEEVWKALLQRIDKHAPIYARPKL